MSPEQNNEQARPGPMLGQLPPGYDAIAEVKRLLRATRSGALATIERTHGHPFATLVTVATDHDGSPILLMSQLSAHTKNLDAEPRCSILLAQGGKGDPLAHPRLTVYGRAVKHNEPAARARLKSRFLARHPKSALYADFGDFAFWRLEVEGAHLNGGFAKAADYEAAAVLTPLAGADSVIAAEAGAIEHMNADHLEALSLYATEIAGEPAARWRASGIDPEGLDLSAGDLTARIAFPNRISSPGDLRDVLVALAAQARRKP
jgi:putative heme iron utilization protein